MLTSQPIAIREALRDAGVGLGDIDAFAYTRGPGMRACLTLGGTSAKALAAITGKPIYGIHHMVSRLILRFIPAHPAQQAHALTCYMTEPTPPTVPFLCLLVSGGHTMLVLVSALDSFKILVDCTDNAVGNAFDRVGRDLQLPADPERGTGAVLEAYAAASTTEIPGLDALPVPLTKDGAARRRLEYSFAGLISQVKRILEIIGFDPENPDVEQQRVVAKLFQDAAVAHLVQKISVVLDSFVDPQTRPTGIVISGGVGSNAYLREEVKWLLRKHRHGSNMQAFYPPPALCTGEPGMIYHSHDQADACRQCGHDRLDGHSAHTGRRQVRIVRPAVPQRVEPGRAVQ